MKPLVVMCGSVVLFTLCATSVASAETQDISSGWGVNVRGYGATGDGSTKDTVAVQKAIDTCAEAGGGTVYFPSGVYLCGSLHLRSGVTLRLDAGATIKGSRDLDDYDKYEQLGFENDADRETTYFHFALIWGEDIERIAILGEGTIDSNWDRRHGPKTIALKRCRFVDIKGIRTTNSPNYAISMLGTDYVNIEGVTILNAYADGIDPDSCRNVRISNCHIESRDDAIVPKASFSLGERRASENITVTNCFLSTECNAFKLGTESGGGFKRIAVTNCVMSGLKGHRPASGGIALESVDGADLDGVVVSNITMVDVRAPIFIRLGNRGRDMDTPIPGTVKNIAIDNVVATNASLTCSITGIPGHRVEGVSVSNVRIQFAGGTPYRPPDQPVPELEDKYPDPDMFDGLPAYGLYCRHVDGLTLSNVSVSYADGFWRLPAESDKGIEWNTESGVPTPSAPGEPGHALICDDVRRLDVNGLYARPSASGAGLIRFVGVQDARVRGCAAAEGTAAFLELLGGETRAIALLGNDLARAGKALTMAEDVPADAVAKAGNIE